jgi:maltose-binding protein MalE
MSGNAPHLRQRPVRPLALIACALLAASALAGCSSSSSAKTNSALQGSVRQQACTAVAAVLADGPDPDADSVGYAQAQVLPLRQLKLADSSVQQAVGQLASAYQAFSSASGSAGAADAIAVTKAQNAVNALCPGAAS